MQIHKHSCFLITQKIELHTDHCWRHSRSQTLSQAPSEKSLFKFIIDNSKFQRTLSRVNCSCSGFFIAIKFFFSFSWPAADVMKETINTDSILKSTHRWDFQYKSVSGSLCLVEQIATMFLPPWSNFVIHLQV